jgi:hypothetical protein
MKKTGGGHGLEEETDGGRELEEEDTGGGHTERRRLPVGAGSRSRSARARREVSDRPFPRSVFQSLRFEKGQRTIPNITSRSDWLSHSQTRHVKCSSVCETLRVTRNVG